MSPKLISAREMPGLPLVAVFVAVRVRVNQKFTSKADPGTKRRSESEKTGEDNKK